MRRRGDKRGGRHRHRPRAGRGDLRNIRSPNYESDPKGSAELLKCLKLDGMLTALNPRDRRVRGLKHVREIDLCELLVDPAIDDRPGNRSIRSESVMNFAIAFVTLVAGGCRLLTGVTDWAGLVAGIHGANLAHTLTLSSPEIRARPTQSPAAVCAVLHPFVP